jgi:hypothetical protein
MLLNRAALLEGEKLQSGYFYIPRLGQLNAPSYLPVLMSRFVARYRTLFDDGFHIPKRLELSEFGDLADRLHVLVLDTTGDNWTFERFAPFSAARAGVDMTSADVNDQRFAPFNRRLDEKLARLLREKAPFYAGTELKEIGGERVAHRLFIPMSDGRRPITHCLLMSV